MFLFLPKFTTISSSTFISMVMQYLDVTTDMGSRLEMYWGLYYTSSSERILNDPHWVQYNIHPFDREFIVAQGLTLLNSWRF